MVWPGCEEGPNQNREHQRSKAGWVPGDDWEPLELRGEDTAEEKDPTYAADRNHRGSEAQEPAIAGESGATRRENSRGQGEQRAKDQSR